MRPAEPTEHRSSATLTVENLPGYLQSRPELARQVQIEGLQVTEVGDGNLNQVFICRGTDGRALVLKQALPYVRLVGPSWPMTEERAAREANAMQVHAALSDRVCALIDYDPDFHVLALEDLTDHTVLRTYLNQGHDITGVPAILGRHMADTGFGTSYVAVGEESFRLAAAAAVNTELCALTEDVVFTEPFLGSERNSLQHPEAGQLVADLQADPAWVAGAMRAKRRFVTVAEALVHGDLHTGSVFVRPAADAPGGWSVRTFDPEFAYYGPIGFDIGLFCANLVLAAARADALADKDRRDALIAGLDDTWSAFESRFRELYAGRPRPEKYPDPVVDAWLADIRSDTWGFAGCEIARRIIGLAKVSDIESLGRDAYLRAAERSLAVSRVLLVDGEFPDLAAVFAR
ncbi:5-methylthioribose kinase [Nakamurella sp. UYEF19]|uniref:S-methyl-5-thioribose kinase n=1 Tax=Nakamurella sp. UYEF19 TaxID=1756392 RepID=UPI003391A603